MLVRPMALSQGALAIAVACFLIACQSTRVAGIPIYGRLQDVSRADIQEAIDANGPIDKPEEIQVVSSTEMHAYFGSRDLGWTPVRPYPIVEPDGRRHFGWFLDARDIRDSPKVLRFIRTADRVYIFTVTTPLRPRRDDTHLRLLQPEARKQLVTLLGYQQDWFWAHDSRFSVGREPTNIGLIFRHGRDELILFFSAGGVVTGAYNGQHTSGTLDDGVKEEEANQKIENWKRRYAQPELRGRGLTRRCSQRSTAYDFIFHD
jgi:hypothetical protein